MSPDLIETLAYLSTAGSAVVVAMLLSYVAEHSARFQAWTPDAKRATQLGGSVAVALAAYAVVTYVPADTLAALAPWWRVAFVSAIAALGNQAWHKLTK